MLTDGQLYLVHLACCALCLVHFGSSLCFWLYWVRTLDLCGKEGNCGCVLYGKSTTTTFRGGHVAYCYYVTLASLPVIFISFVNFIYNAYVACISRKRAASLSKSYRAPKEKKPPVVRHIIGAVLSSISAALIFSAAVIITDGYLKTCRQYKKRVAEQISANGNLASVIIDRLGCSASFDFMDYLQPDPPVLDYKYRRGSWLINTDVALKISIFSLWITFVLLITVLSHHVVLLCKKRPSILLTTSL